MQRYEIVEHFSGLGHSRVWLTDLHIMHIPTDLFAVFFLQVYTISPHHGELYRLMALRDELRLDGARCLPNRAQRNVDRRTWFARL